MRKTCPRVKEVGVEQLRGDNPKAPPAKRAAARTWLGAIADGWYRGRRLGADDTDRIADRIDGKPVQAVQVTSQVQQIVRVVLHDEPARPELVGHVADGAPALETSLPGVRAVWFDRDGGYFLGTHESSAVWYVDADGIIHKFLGEPEISEVRGLSLDGAGNLIVVGDDRGLVWRLEALSPR